MNDFFSKTVCDRCGRSLSAGRIMSMFNTDTICMKCKEEEERRPDYKQATDEEQAAVLKRNYGFPGIGLPNDKQEEKTCRICGAKIAWPHPSVSDKMCHSSDDIEGWPICHSCMIEHCCSTNCLSCEYRTAKQFQNCRFWATKQFYRNQNEKI